MRRLGVALLVSVLWQGRAVAEPGDPWDSDRGTPEAAKEAPAEGGEEGADAPTPAELAAHAAKPVKAKPARAARPAKPKKITLQWHRKPRRGAKLIGALVPDELLRSTPLPRPSGNLHLYVLATHESLKVNIYNDDGSYNVESLRAVSHILRCKRTDAEKDIEPRLLTVLSTIYDHFGGKPLQVVSAYRNQRRTTSYHFHGSASDIRIAGVKQPKLRDYAASLDAGGMGIGLYPRADFVHVDIRPPPSYRWIDYARSNPDNPDKAPPKGWKRKELKS
jgi:uncharacterized protein YcbK (DUF882 family)